MSPRLLPSLQLAPRPLTREFFLTFRESISNVSRSSPSCSSSIYPPGGTVSKRRQRSWPRVKEGRSVSKLHKRNVFSRGNELLYCSTRVIISHLSKWHGRRSSTAPRRGSRQSCSTHHFLELFYFLFSHYAVRVIALQVPLFSASSRSKTPGSGVRLLVCNKLAKCLRIAPQHTQQQCRGRQITFECSYINCCLPVTGPASPDFIAPSIKLTTGRDGPIEYCSVSRRE